MAASAPARAAYTPPRPAVAPPAAPASSASVAAGSSVRLQYTDQAPVQVRGLATGLSYTFSAAQPLLDVDPRDVASLLQTRFFRRA